MALFRKQAFGTLGRFTSIHLYLPYSKHALLLTADCTTASIFASLSLSCARPVYHKTEGIDYILLYYRIKQYRCC